jgi:hypothetical protein
MRVLMFCTSLLALVFLAAVLCWLWTQCQIHETQKVEQTKEQSR